MAEPEYVNFTRERFERFKKVFAACDGDVFTFENKPFLKTYAKHLIKYLGKHFSEEESDG
jgi:hypothetical protein